MNATLALAAMIVLTPQSPKDFLIGYWCGVKTGSDYDARYAEVKECGFTYAFPATDFWHNTLETNRKMLDACAKQGIKCVIVDMRLVRAKPDDPKFDSIIDAVVKDYSSHPAMAAYWLADEPSPEGIPRLAAIAVALRKKDPKHFSFVNLFPAIVEHHVSWKCSYEDYVKDFCDLVDPDILSFDNYALLANDKEQPGHFGNLEIIRRHALRKGIPACFICQAICTDGLRDPSPADYRWQMNTTLAYGFKAIMYFYYWSPPGKDGALNDIGILDSEGNRTHRYARIKRANADLATLAPTLLKLTSTGVHHTGDIPLGCKPLDASAPVQQLSGGPLVIGTFRHEDGSHWLIIVNRDPRHSTRADLAFPATVKSLHQISPQTGIALDVPLTDGKASFELEAGEGALLKLVK